jgi:pimeloyl-ACP methyl ester carboxylesterase
MRERAPVAVCVHGAGGGGWEWAIWARVFAARGWRVVAPDLLPVAEGLAATALADYRAQVLAWCAQASTPPVLIGASLGGLLALSVAAQANESALVLVNPLPPWGLPAGAPAPPIVRWGSARRFASTRRAMPDADDAARLSPSAAGVTNPVACSTKRGADSLSKRRLVRCWSSPARMTTRCLARRAAGWRRISTPISAKWPARATSGRCSVAARRASPKTSSIGCTCVFARARFNLGLSRRPYPAALCEARTALADTDQPDPASPAVREVLLDAPGSLRLASDAMPWQRSLRWENRCGTGACSGSVSRSRSSSPCSKSAASRSACARTTVRTIGARQCLR